MKRKWGGGKLEGVPCCPQQWRKRQGSESQGRWKRWRIEDVFPLGGDWWLCIPSSSNKSRIPPLGHIPNLNQPTSPLPFHPPSTLLFFSASLPYTQQRYYCNLVSSFQNKNLRKGPRNTKSSISLLLCCFQNYAPP